MNNSTLTFRSFSADDSAELAVWTSDPLVKFHWTANTFAYPVAAQDVAEHITLALSSTDRRCIGFWDRTDNANPIAYAELAQIDIANGCGRIERMILAPGKRGKGIGRIVVRHLEDLFFRDPAMHRLELVVASDNAAGKRCYEAAGFHMEGQFREARRFESEWRSVDLMGILRQEWGAMP